MKFLIIVFLLFSMNTSLFAAKVGYQIIITKTSKKSSLKLIKKRLDSIDVKMFVKKSKNAYTIYSSRYKKLNNAQNVLRRIKKYFKYANILTLNKKSSAKKTKIASSYKKVKQKNFTTSKIESDDTTTMFVNVGFGSGSVAGDSQGVSYNLEMGYVYSETLFISLGYLNLSTSKIETHNVYTSLNYDFDFDSDYGVYAGAIFGFGTLQLTEFVVSEASSSFIFGGQVGIIHNIYNNFSIYGEYKLLSMDHIIISTDTSSSTSYNIIHNFQIGINFKF